MSVTKVPKVLHMYNCKLQCIENLRFCLQLKKGITSLVVVVIVFESWRLISKITLNCNSKEMNVLERGVITYAPAASTFATRRGNRWID